MDHSQPATLDWFARLELEQEVEALYEDCSAELLSYAANLVRGEDSASDAIQEVFLRYFVERSYGRIIDNPRGWLFRVLRNYLFDRLERAAQQREVRVVDFDQVPDPSVGAECVVQRAELAEALSSEFSAREMQCLRLRAGGASYEEIAESLGIRAGTVSSLLTRAHKKLRATLDGQARAPAETVGALMFLFGGGLSESS